MAAILLVLMFGVALACSDTLALIGLGSCGAKKSVNLLKDLLGNRGNPVRVDKSGSLAEATGLDGLDNHIGLIGGIVPHAVRSCDFAPGVKEIDRFAWWEERGR